MYQVIFAHGLESSPGGTKATYLGEHFGAITPPLRHLNLPGQVDALEQELALGDKSIVVGSSLGGLAALGVANRFPARIEHLVLLAPAVSSYRKPEAFDDTEKTRPGLREEALEMAELSVPQSIPATIIHGIDDEVVFAEDVVKLCRRSSSARLVLVRDDHFLVRARELIVSVVGRAAKGQDPLVLL